MSYLPGMEPPAEPVPPSLPDLAAGLETALFFDIETAGLAVDSAVTMIATLCGDRLRVYLRGADLNDFLGRLEEPGLAVSFNGAGFDVPRLLNTFHIPAFGRPHLDLRPVCRQHGLTGGLKKIERDLGIHRPADLQGVTGEDAEWMWRGWERDRDAGLLRRLIRYCAADVIALRLLAERLLNRPPPLAAWSLLDSLSAPTPEVAAAPLPPFADRSHERLRAHLRRKKNL